MEEEKRYWIACAGIEGIGRVTFDRILAFKKSRNISWAETWQRIVTHHPEFGFTDRQCAHITSFRQKFTPSSYFDWLLSQGIRALTSRDKEYPELLQQIDDKPFVLFTKGEWKWGQLPVAIVGTRRATSYGRMVTERIVEELTCNGATIISGFMYGVDTIAHTQAVAGGAHTIGVLGYGFNHCFPQSHRRLFPQLLEKGMTFITEFPPQVQAFPGNFPVRNRIVAGLSVATIVTEAGIGSGSLITAELAVNYHRLVGAVPGPITNPYAEGTKWLINQGATLITSGADVLEELQYQVPVPRPVKRPASSSVISDPLQRQIFTLLEGEALTPEHLSRELGISLPSLNSTLSLMELEGSIIREGDVWRIR